MAPVAMHTLEDNHEWIRRNMPRTRAACERMPDMSGVRLAYSGHIEPKMADVLVAARRRGAEVFAISCNPTTVRDGVIAYLQEHGVGTHAWAGMSERDYRESIAAALAWRPTHTCEMGADLSLQAGDDHDIAIALEATGSGIARLADHPPAYPVFNWDDLPIKEGLHNRHMVGLSTWHTFMQRTWLSLHGKHVVVVGFGLVGEGVAEKARVFGAVVSVVDTDPGKRMQASYAGWNTGSLLELAPSADVLVTATGVAGAIDARVLRALKPGCFLLNVGHRADEIELDALGARTSIVPHVESCRIDGKELLLFAGGSMANLTAGFGDSLNAFDVTAATMAEGIAFIATAEPGDWRDGVHPLPREIWLRALRAPDARGDRPCR